MKLLTKALEKKLPKLYATDDLPMEETMAIIKYFTPDSNLTWYVVEGEYDADLKTWRLFGVTTGLDDPEIGYFTLRQLEEVRGKLGLPVERDLYFEPVACSDLLKNNP